MDAEFYQYMTRLHSYVEHQSKKISKLEKKIGTLQEEIESLKQRAPVQIGTMEYKFDQLKVERLEGTLNIGFNPADMEDIDDFTVDQKAMRVQTPRQLFKNNIELENELNQFLETDLEEIYRNAQKQLRIVVEDSYYQFIKDDIKKQLSGRIATHLKELSATEDGMNNSHEEKEKIIKLLKQEIENGVYLFLKNLPDNVKETLQE